ncbi:MAG TPA: nickel pincer cofactor biosynthesis protein LarB [Firmicutes bacterium]|nr:nickel pincer cofactor biosynthesis protein LarB [Bacillota bacterium]HHY98736.1 nickel pincer cofactor biosynthesis protein LarB [Bacillota bacterium]
MDAEYLRGLLESVKEGRISIDKALVELRDLPFEDLGFAKVDHHRALRKGFPEVIYCKGKSIEQIKQIVKALTARSDNIMATRADRNIFDAIREISDDVVYYELARIVVVRPVARATTNGIILVVAAGTADLPVAEEAAVTAEVMGNTVKRLYDVGVAGLHRLLSHREELLSARVIIVVAGMEGALASVIGGMVDKPIIAVPTSTGYGASFHGLAALLSMLNSCASGVGVVNIDNGFGAGYLAALINKIGEPATRVDDE